MRLNRFFLSGAAALVIAACQSNPVVGENAVDVPMDEMDAKGALDVTLHEGAFADIQHFTTPGGGVSLACF